MAIILVVGSIGSFRRRMRRVSTLMQRPNQRLRLQAGAWHVETALPCFLNESIEEPNRMFIESSVVSTLDRFRESDQLVSTVEFAPLERRIFVDTQRRQ